jgi:membrane-bound lytic murein transglycosylase A
LRGKDLELAWLKSPVDVAFLHIQGSGRLRLNDGGTLNVGYSTEMAVPIAASAATCWTRGFSRREEMSMQAIRGYLSEHPEMIPDILNHNPSYIFFRPFKTDPSAISVFR